MAGSYGATYVGDDADEDLLTGPPKAFLAIISLEVVLSAACLVPGSRAANWIGYALGAWLVALTTIVFRHVDRQRSADPSYIPERYVGRLVALLLLLGLAVAALHSYFLAKVVVFL